MVQLFLLNLPTMWCCLCNSLYSFAIFIQMYLNGQCFLIMQQINQRIMRLTSQEIITQFGVMVHEGNALII